MSHVAVVPIKSFRAGMARLDGALSPEQREALGRALAAHVVDVAARAGLTPVVVSSDEEVLLWARDRGLMTIVDSRQGLDRAADLGVSWATERGRRWMVIHSDLPLLTEAEVLGVARAAEDSGWAIAPSADGGTSVIAGEGAFHFAFGVGSFHRHLRSRPEMAVVTSPGTLLDIDRPGDLNAATRTPAGSWVSELLH